jgi:hypothetical protein
MSSDRLDQIEFMLEALTARFDASDAQFRPTYTQRYVRNAHGRPRQHTHSHTQNRSNYMNNGTREFVNSTYRRGERAPAHNNRAQSGTRSENVNWKPRANTHALINRSADTASLAHQLYRCVQLRQHSRSWSSLPRGVDAQVDGLFKSITPPAPTIPFWDEMERLQGNLVSDIKSAVAQHITHTLAETRQLLTEANPVGLDRALREADQLLARRHKKISAYNRKTWLAEESALVGTGVHLIATPPVHNEHTHMQSGASTYAQAVNNTRDIRTPDTHAANSTEVCSLAAELEIETSSHTSQADSVAFTMVAHGARKRSNAEVSPTTPPLPVRNRFAALDNYVLETPEKRRLIVRSRSLERPKSGTSEPCILEEAADLPEFDHTYSSSQPSNSRAGQDDGTRIQEEMDDTVEDDVESVAEEPAAAAAAATHPGTNKVVHFNTAHKFSWKLKSLTNDAHTLILADSNMRGASSVKTGYELHVYPGCKLHHAEHMIKSAVINSSVRNIVIAVGINNRSDPAHTLTATLQSIIDTCKNLRTTCHFLGVSTDGSLPPRENNNVDGLNRMARDLFRSAAYVRPLASSAVSISLNDKFHIHHTTQTVDAIIDTIYKHFL